MTLELKTNVVVKNYIISALEMTIPSDYNAKLDFWKGDYVLNGKKKTLTEMISTTRSTVAGFTNKDGFYSEVAANVPRIHYDEKVGIGLLCEAAVTNLVANPTQPVSQIVSVNLTTTNYLIFQVFGVGQAEITIGSVASGIVTQDQPFIYKASAVQTVNVNITVTGNLTHFQLFQSNSAKPIQTHIKNSQAADIHYFKQTPHRKGTLILKRSEIPDLTNIIATGRSFTIVQMLEKTSGAILLASSKSSTLSQKLLKYSNASITNSSAEYKFDVVNYDETIAISWDLDTLQVKILSSGNIFKQTVTAMNGVDGIDRLILGTTATGWGATCEQIIKELYVYDRVLTDNELLAIKGE
ncbi:hypothetical protein OLN41_05180 [Acinetobacter baumannii]|uniref:hypothetical protein n=1 Tax=Acinetobacter baumannii TaxID=470 RepID=UPI002221E3E6|nr:hypothetical protein [Acinetobacter baumannii]MCW1508529.1 hypothetical protein [Acinetobacter baumannii]